MEIYILIDNEPQGPYPQELVRINLKSGQLKATDLAAYAGSADWRPLSMMMESWGDSSSDASTKRKSTGVILAMLVLLVVVAGAAFWMMRNRPVADAKNSSPKTEPNTLVQLEDDGYPKTPAELDKWYVEPPEGQNAATYFLQGGSAILVTNEDYDSQSLPLFGQARFPTNGSLSLNQRKDIARFVLKNEAAWKLLQKGLPFEHARYPIDLTQGEDVSLQHLPKVRRAEQLAALWMVLSAANKQPQPAVNAFLFSLAAAQSLKDEPVLVSQLVRVGSIQLQRTALQFIFNSVVVQPADLDRLAAGLAKVEAEEADGVSFTRALAGERVLALSFFDWPPEKVKKQIEELREIGMPSWTNMTAGQMMTNLPAQRAFMIETISQELALRKEPFPERLKIEEYVRSRAAEAKNNQFYLVQALLEGSDHEQREATGLANVRLMQTAVALEQFRRANRKYPDALAELVPKFLPAVPKDPFNGEPLFYLGAVGYELRCTGATGSPIQFKVEAPPR